MTWSQIAAVEAKGDAAIMLEDGRILQLDPPRATRIYNPKRDRWATTGMPVKPKAKQRTLARTAEGWVVAAGGEAGDPIKSCELWKSNEWMPIPDLLASSYGHACVTVHSRVYVIGGKPRLDYYAPQLKTMLSWEPGEDAWRVETPLPYELAYVKAIVLDDHSIVAVGWTNSEVHAVRWDGKAWGVIDAVGASSLVATPGGGFLAIGGTLGRDATGDQLRDEASDRVRAWTPERGWQARTPLPRARRKASAVRLADGRIALIGGERTERRWEDHSDGGELDYEYRSFYRWYLYEYLVDSVFLEDGHGWREIPAPTLRGYDVFALSDGRVIVDLEQIWTPPP